MSTVSPVPTSQSMRALLLRTAKSMSDAGPGFAQEGVVLRQAIKELGTGDLDMQQQILTCWHDLFREGVLAWGYNVDNPGPPFFHFARRTP